MNHQFKAKYYLKHGSFLGKHVVVGYNVVRCEFREAWGQVQGHNVSDTPARILTLKSENDRIHNACKDVITTLHD